MIISDIVKNTNENKKDVSFASSYSDKNSNRIYEPLEQEIYEGKKQTQYTFWLWTIFMVLVIAGGVYTWHKYSYATVSIQTQKVPYAFTNTPFTATRNNTDATTTPFEVMVVEDTYKQTVTYGTKNVATKKSKGSILVQNSASVKKITLKKGSVAVSNTGLHYIVLNGATIPGYAKKGTVITPGSTEVVVEAEKNGAEYDVTGATFTFPNYAGKTNLLTAKTIGLGIVGGANGNMYTMNEEELSRITNNIQESAKNKIFIKANAEIPPGYRIYKNAVVYKTDTLSGLRESSTAVRDITQNSTLTAYLFRDRDIEKFIFNHSEHTLQDPAYSASNIDQSDITLIATPVDPKNTTTLALQFTGNGIINWTVDENELRKSLSGVRKNTVETIFAGFKTIDSAYVKTNPWFERYLPLDTKRIRVDIN